MEKLGILSMIKEGIITPEEGMNLLEAIEISESKIKTYSGKKTISKEPRWINIEIKNHKHQKKISLLKIPYSLFSLFLRFLPKEHNIPGYDVNLDEIIESLKDGEPIDLVVEKNGKYISITAE